MPKFHDVRITLVEQRQRCHAGHQVGDSWVCGRFTPQGMCLGAFSALLPYITTLRFGGNFPWEQSQGEGFFVCPDHLVCNLFHLERLGEEQR